MEPRCLHSPGCCGDHRHSQTPPTERCPLPPQPSSASPGPEAVMAGARWLWFSWSDQKQQVSGWGWLWQWAPPSPSWGQGSWGKQSACQPGGLQNVNPVAFVPLCPSTQTDAASLKTHRS